MSLVTRAPAHSPEVDRRAARRGALFVAEYRLRCIDSIVQPADELGWRMRWSSKVLVTPADTANRKTASNKAFVLPANDDFCAATADVYDQAHLV